MHVQAKPVTGNLGAWTIDVTYDPKAVKVIDCKGQNGSVCNASFAAGTVRITGASASGLSGTQTLATISFERIGQGKSTSRLSAQVVTLTNQAGQAIQVEAPP